MKHIRQVLAAGVGALAFAVAPAAAAAQAPCDPFGPATFRGAVPTPKQVIGFDLGKRDVTTAQSDAYVAAVDAASDRVVTGELGRSVEGRPLRYAIVGRPERVTQAGLAGVRAAAAKLMDPATSAAEAAAIAAADPAVLWIAANVHGGEESGTDASLRVLWELADRSDCAAQRILDAAVVVILPIQNPDGREADTRRNAYGFDMNRDWFARTQPETDGKVELLRRYPPVVFVDAHEMGNTAGYFFPPNADPVYHEISDEAIGWINGLYGPAMQQVFDARADPVLQLRQLRPVLHGLRRHGAGDRLRRGGHDVREDRFRPDAQARGGAVPDPMDDAVGGGGAQAGGARGMAPIMGDGARRGSCRPAPAQRGGAAREHRSAGSAGHHRPPVLHP